MERSQHKRSFGPHLHAKKIALQGAQPRGFRLHVPLGDPAKRRQRTRWLVLLYRGQPKYQPPVCAKKTWRFSGRQTEGQTFAGVPAPYFLAPSAEKCRRRTHHGYRSHRRGCGLYRSCRRRKLVRLLRIQPELPSLRRLDRVCGGETGGATGGFGRVPPASPARALSVAVALLPTLSSIAPRLRCHRLLLFLLFSRVARQMPGDERRPIVHGPLSLRLVAPVCGHHAAWAVVLVAGRGRLEA